ncbi:hypothetical protein [Dongia sp.]|jgi:hypothetical protein|uniref:hypothetical protein n=1 Tax=Dongia sp. TaxID=1977262 RepID=UPI0035B18183
MSSETDPAKELAEVCAKLSGASKHKGDEHLAKKFGVPAWSSEFYLILFSIVDRANFLADLIDTMNVEQEIKTDARKHIDQLKAAFSRDCLIGTWEQLGHKYLGSNNTQPIKMLSPVVKKVVSYPKLDDQAIAELVEQIDGLLTWLRDAQLKENDFIRQAIIDGLTALRFRLEKIGWLGWGYTIDSLQKLVGAYLALERNLPQDGADPVAQALLLKLGLLAKNIYSKARAVKEGVEMGQFALAVYGAYSLVKENGLAGLLEAPN